MGKGKDDFSINILLVIASFMLILFVAVQVFTTGHTTNGYTANNVYEQISELQQQVEYLEKQNVELHNKIDALQSNVEVIEEAEQLTVGEILLLSDEEKEWFKKYIAYFCKDAPNATKMYVSYVVVNLMVDQELTFWEALSTLNVTQSDLEWIVYENSDVMVLRKVLKCTAEEVAERSSNATFFCETKEYEKYIGNDMQVLFTSENYTFFTNLTVG